MIIKIYIKHKNLSFKKNKTINILILKWWILMIKKIHLQKKQNKII
jgi:hypothetical protein